MSASAEIALDDDVLEALDAFIADHEAPPAEPMTRQDALNIIIRDWLMGQGYMALPGDDSQIVPAMEAAQVPK